VNPNANLQEAMTIMMINDYSQLPVMQSERDVKGAVSWTTIGQRIALGKDHTSVKDCMESYVPEVPADASVFSTIDLIVSHGFVLVRRPDRLISGIVTTADLSVEFRSLTEPFLLVGEIENSVRRLIDGKFSPEEISSALDPGGQKTVNTVGELSFGDYVYLLQNPANWIILGVPVDGVVFVDRLNKVRKIRNDVMHFNPDPLEHEDLLTLRSFVNFLRELMPSGT